MDYSNIFAKFINELLSKDIEPLEKDFYEKTIRELNALKGESFFTKSITTTLKILFIIRLIKEISMFIKEPSKLNLEYLPSLERKILRSVEEALRSLELQPLAETPSEKENTPLHIEEIRQEPPTLNDKKREEMTLVFFLQPYPRIMDRDLNLGPFNKGDIALLPKRLAKDLVVAGYVEEIPSTEHVALKGSSE